MAPEPVTTTVWLEQQLQRAQARVDGLAHEVEQLRESLRTEQAEASTLRQELALLNGRTSRHESSLDQIRGLQQQVATLEQRIEAEVALRRDQTGSIGREQRRDAEAQQSQEQALNRLDAHIGEITQRLASIEERHHHLVDDVGAVTREDMAAGGRLDALERRAEALAASVHRAVDDQSAVAEVIPGLRLALDAVEARTRALQEEQQRFEDDLARLVPSIDVQTVVDDAVEQVRSLRERVEQRLRTLEEQTAETSQAQRQMAEERALLTRQLASHEEQMRALAGRLEAEREALLAHVRRVTAAAEETGRRQMQEIDRQTRAGRELMTRLTEHSDEIAREQPL